MALHYQTECRMGTRRINRSYSGYQAFVAIVFDLDLRPVVRAGRERALVWLSASSPSRFGSRFTC